jgi:hypothetical protein
MSPEDFKQSHWMLIGLLIGFLFGAVRTWSGPSFVMANADTIEQGEFEWAVSGQAHQSTSQMLRVDQSTVQRTASANGVIVHPPSEGDPPGTLWVTGTMRAFTQRSADDNPSKGLIVRVEEWRPFRYQSKLPYIAFTGAPGKYPSVTEYLKVLSNDENLKFSYSYGWWERPRWTMTISLSGGFLMIGVIWPAILNFLNRAGWGRDPAEKLMRLSSGKSATARKSGTTQSNMVQDFEWERDPSVAEAMPTITMKPATPVVAALPGSSADSTDVSEAPKVDVDVEYQGEFYPVAKPKSTDTG